MTDAQSVIDSQIKAFRAGENVEAFSYAAPNLQAMFRNHQNFIAMVKQGYGAIYGAQSWTFGRSKIEDGTLYQEMLITGPKGPWLGRALFPAAGKRRHMAHPRRAAGQGRAANDLTGWF